MANAANAMSAQRRDAHEMMAEIFNNLDRQSENRILAALPHGESDRVPAPTNARSANMEAITACCNAVIPEWFASDGWFKPLRGVATGVFLCIKLGLYQKECHLPRLFFPS